MATGSSLTPNYYRSQSEIEGDLHSPTQLKQLTTAVTDKYSMLERIEEAPPQIESDFGQWIEMQYPVDDIASRTASVNCGFALRNWSSKEPVSFKPFDKLHYSSTQYGSVLRFHFFPRAKFWNETQLLTLLSNRATSTNIRVMIPF
ncbi:hypothetical protein TNCV_3229151 [Trichonephila clavipes]|nr:hypothetical protein TNCV_3229151 [Trichonephila clavipes]